MGGRDEMEGVAGCVMGLALSASVSSGVTSVWGRWSHWYLQMLIGGSVKGTVSPDEGQSSRLPAWYRDRETGPDGGLT